MTFTIQVKTSHLLDFVELAQVILAGVIGGIPPIMRVLDLDICKQLWWIIMRGLDVPVQGGLGCAHSELMICIFIYLNKLVMNNFRLW